MAIEIERKFLLRSMPVLPPGSIALRMEQGYLDPPDAPDAPREGAAAREGRIRRTQRGDGTVVCHHTIKSGLGMVREETEREIAETEFERLWPRTQGQRIEKIRHVVPAGSVAWEIDEFIRPPCLVLAEAEAPSVEAARAIEIPEWLAACIEREVTDDPTYNNRAIARRAAMLPDLH